MSNNQIQADKNTELDNSYQALLQELKSILDTGLGKAYKAVDNIKVQTYWQLGERIVREELKYENRAEYGKTLIKKLSVDIGIRERGLYEIVEFFQSYKNLRTVSANLSWSHYLDLIKLKKLEERMFYEQQTIKNSWSVRQLRDHIKNDLYGETSAVEIEQTLRTTLSTNTDLSIFRNQHSTYKLNFIDPPMNHKEKDIEDGIIHNIDLFLQELGEEFCFVGRQVSIKIAGETHNIDLVLFHKGIPCTVLVELKNRKFDAGDVGQVNKYVSYWRDNRQYVYEKDAIGLILCREANSEEVAYVLRGLEESIFVATYKTKLPSDEQIKQAVRKAT